MKFKATFSTNNPDIKAEFDNVQVVDTGSGGTDLTPEQINNVNNIPNKVDKVDGYGLSKVSTDYFGEVITHDVVMPDGTTQSVSSYTKNGVNKKVNPIANTLNNQRYYGIAEDFTDTGCGSYAIHFDSNSVSISLPITETDIIVPYEITPSSGSDDDFTAVVTYPVTGIYSSGSTASAVDVKTITIPTTITSIEDNALDIYPNAIIYVKSGSYAEQWCIEHGREYKLTDVNIDLTEYQEKLSDKQINDINSIDDISERLSEAYPEYDFDETYTITEEEATANAWRRTTDLQGNPIRLSEMQVDFTIPPGANTGVQYLYFLYDKGNNPQLSDGMRIAEFTYQHASKERRIRVLCLKLRDTFYAIRGYAWTSGDNYTSMQATSGARMILGRFLEDPRPLLGCWFNVASGMPAAGTVVRIRGKRINEN